MRPLSLLAAVLSLAIGASAGGAAASAHKVHPVGKSQEGGGRIVDGVKVDSLGELPWQVELVYYNPASGKNPAFYYHECGGALIAPQWVMTAAHCVADAVTGAAGAEWRMSSLAARTAPSYVIAGSLVSADVSPPAWRAAIEMDAGHVFVKPDYVPASVTKVGARVIKITFALNDIALIRLDEAAPISDAIGVLFDIERPDAPPAAPEVQLAGWGAISEADAERRIMSFDLRVTDPPLHLFSPSECEIQTQARYPHAKGFPSSLLCAGPNPANAASAARLGSHEDACRGDSGGALTRKESGSVTAVGIASWELVCGKGSALYTNVASFRGWIVDTIAANGGPGSPAGGLGVAGPAVRP
jgi:secreted trypsin-like serine protease